jgi:hypothetical protein
VWISLGAATSGEISAPGSAGEGDHETSYSQYEYDVTHDVERLWELMRARHGLPRCDSFVRALGKARMDVREIFIDT